MNRVVSTGQLGPTDKRTSLTHIFNESKTTNPPPNIDIHKQSHTETQTHTHTHGPIHTHTHTHNHPPTHMHLHNTHTHTHNYPYIHTHIPPFLSIRNLLKNAGTDRNSYPGVLFKNRRILEGRGKFRARYVTFCLFDDHDPLSC